MNVWLIMEDATISLFVPIYQDPEIVDSAQMDTLEMDTLAALISMNAILDIVIF